MLLLAKSKCSPGHVSQSTESRHVRTGGGRAPGNSFYGCPQAIEIDALFLGSCRGRPASETLLKSGSNLRADRNVRAGPLRCVSIRPGAPVAPPRCPNGIELARSIRYNLSANRARGRL